jgi:hypothetical protein
MIDRGKPKSRLTRKSSFAAAGPAAPAAAASASFRGATHTVASMASLAADPGLTHFNLFIFPVPVNPGPFDWNSLPSRPDTSREVDGDFGLNFSAQYKNIAGCLVISGTL